MRYWLIRNPYRHQGWEEIIFRNKYCLYGIKGNHAQKQIAAMNHEDKAVFYDRKNMVFAGILEVMREPYPDPTKPESGYLSIDFVPVASLNPPLPYSEIKGHPAFQQCSFFKQPRFTVCEISLEQFQIIS